MEAIILAGGFGTRLHSIINDVPKPMADIGGKPFLHHLLTYLKNQAITKVILSVGYKHELISGYFKDNYIGIEIVYSIEDTPLGTGGAVNQSLEYTTESEVFVLNGDTLFTIQLLDLIQTKRKTNADVIIGLKKIAHSDRYGTVLLNQDGRIIDFNEKQFCSEGLINGGVYLLGKTCFIEHNKRVDRFSIEKDFFSLKVREIEIFGSASDAFFIDIGIPEDYDLAKSLIGKEVIKF